MRQGWNAVLLAAALVCAAMPIGVGHAHAAAAKSSTARASTEKRPSLRQFTGWVTALDKGSITVEKRGKTPRTITFVRHAEMSTKGDLEKDAHVTVYYRDEGGRMTAHRVVVKTGEASAANGR